MQLLLVSGMGSTRCSYRSIFRAFCPILHRILILGVVKVDHKRVGSVSELRIQQGYGSRRPITHRVGRVLPSDEFGGAFDVA